jgi:hypothetical protein
MGRLLPARACVGYNEQPRARSAWLFLRVNPSLERAERGHKRRLENEGKIS